MINESGAKTHCPQGHLLAGDNLYLYDGGRHRACKTCRSDRSRKQYWDDPEKAKKARRERYARDREEINARRRERYARERAERLAQETGQ